jgi:hypothetical protein
VQWGDLEVTRGGWSAFAGTGLAEQLRARDVRQVVLVGVATTFGVESTARDAYDAGFSVLVVSDAVTDRSAADHDLALIEAESDDELLDLMHRVDSKESLADFLGALEESARNHPESWENSRLDRFLEAWSGWLRESDGYFRNRGETPPTQPSWAFVAQMLIAARSYA